MMVCLIVVHSLDTTMLSFDLLIQFFSAGKWGLALITYTKDGLQLCTE